MQKIQVPFFQVDAHNVIPVWKSSDKKEFAAHTLRKKILRNVGEYLTEYPKICYHPFGERQKNKFSFMKVMANLKIENLLQIKD